MANRAQGAVALDEYRKLKADPDALERHNLERAELREKCYKLRLRGLNFLRISDKLKEEGLEVSSAAVAVYIKEHLRLLAANNSDIKEQRQLEIERIEYMIDRLWDQVERGDFEAIGVVNQLSRRKSALLGLDAPTKLRVSVQEKRDPITQDEVEFRYKLLYERLREAGRIQNSLTYEQWRNMPNLGGGAAYRVNKAIDAEFTRLEGVLIPAGQLRRDPKLSE